uniref:Uncharacterized protein n=1 Tax=Ignisphaera aggregans TaxID=334771 RepID=A0A7J3QF04_9CREN
MPSWSIHRLVLSQALQDVCRELSLDSLDREFLKSLYRGVVEPDKVPDRVVRYRLRIGRSSRVKISTRIGYAKHHTVDKTLISYYYYLALYYARRENKMLSGLALGRAIHYAQDSAIKTRKYMLVDVHNEVEKELEALTKNLRKDIQELCRDLKLDKRSSSTQDIEALCISYTQTIEILKNFFIELKQSIDIKKLWKRIWITRTLKTITALTLITTPLLLNIYEALVFTIPIAVGIALYRPRLYYEAMKTGIMVLKPYNYKTAY